MKFVIVVLMAMVAAVQANTLHVTLISAEVENVDGDVGVNTDELPVTKWNGEKFERWVWKKGATDPQVTIRIGDSQSRFQQFKEAKSEWYSNNLTPTFLEHFTFGETSENAELVWAIHDVNLNPADGINSLGRAKLIAEGRALLRQFYNKNTLLTLTDQKNGMKVHLRLDWTTVRACPVNARHPRDASKLWFFADKRRCICDKKYTSMGPSGQCEPYPDWVETCDGAVAKQVCTFCKDKPFEKFSEVCGHSPTPGKKCNFFTCA